MATVTITLLRIAQGDAALAAQLGPPDPSDALATGKTPASVYCVDIIAYTIAKVGTASNEGVEELMRWLVGITL